MSGRGGVAEVDNTGNVRVWPAEEAFAVLLTRWRGLGLLGAWGGASLLEFGAGRSGLAGLVLASKAASGEPSAATAPRSVVITDGHPRAAADLARQCALTQLHCGLRCPLGAATLVWTSDPRAALGRPAAAHFREHSPAPPVTPATAAAAGTSAASTASACTEDTMPSVPWPIAGPLELEPASVDCILAADVAFFERFHTALLETAAFLLRPAHPGALLLAGGDADGPAGTADALSDATLASAVTSPGSLVVLAPSRGGSLERLELAARAFTVERGDSRQGSGSGSGAEAEESAVPAFAVRRIKGVGPWLSEKALCGAPIEGQDDAAAGPLELLLIQRLAAPAA